MGPADRNEIASTLRIAADSHGFFKEAHPKLRPVETLTAGIFLAGTAQAPKDIPDTVSQASAAASKGMELLSQEILQRDPSTAHVNDSLCAGCFECLQVCPYQAIERREILDSEGALLREVAWPNPAMCEGCGLCTVTCRGGYIDLEGYSDEQVFAQLGALGRPPMGLER
jgi:heterodisulfide reductase subunit A